MPTPGSTIPAHVRHASHYVVDLNSGCWIWTGAHSSQGGYPGFTAEDGGFIYAHRFMFEAVYGPIPEGPCSDGSRRFELHHVCGNRRCTNPSHLRVVTAKEHQTLHLIARAQAREARLQAYTPWIASLLQGGFSPARIKAITNQPLHVVRTVSKAMRLPVQYTSTALLAGEAVAA